MLVVIREFSEDDTGVTVSVRVATKAVKNVYLEVPLLSREMETELEWLLESCDQENPTTSCLRESKCNHRLRQYGQVLFKRVFEDLLDTEDAIHILVEGGSRLQSLHWETMEDPVRGSLALLENCSISRAPLGRFHSSFSLAARNSVNVVFFTSRTQDPSRDLPSRPESIALLELVKNHNLPLRLDVVRPGSSSRLKALLESQSKGFYHIIHFDCHGGTSRDDATLMFEGDMGCNRDPVRFDAISQIIDEYEIPIALFSACRTAYGSSSLAHRLFETCRARYVLAFGYDVLLSTSKCFYVDFYRQLLQGKGVFKATAAARAFMASNKCRTGYKDREILREDWFVPICYGPSDCSDESIVTSEVIDNERLRVETNFRKSVLRNEWRDSDKYFIGREEELQVLEGALFQPEGADNIVVVEGMQGVGKTSFLEYTTWWWQVVGMVEARYWFSFNENVYSSEDILMEICESWERDERFAFRRAKWKSARARKKGLDATKESVLDELCRERYVLVLDNVDCLFIGRSGDRNESSSTPLSTRGDVSNDLARFLDRLQGGKTIVLIGSRGKQDKLLHLVTEQGYSGDSVLRSSNSYPCLQLSCLEPPAALQLAKDVLSPSQLPALADSPWSFRLLRAFNGLPELLRKVFPSAYAFIRHNNSTSIDAVEKSVDDQLQQSSKWRNSTDLCCSKLSEEELVVVLHLSLFRESVSSEMLQNLIALILRAHSNVTSEIFDDCMNMLRRYGMLAIHKQEHGVRFHPGCWAVVRKCMQAADGTNSVSPTEFGLLRIRTLSLVHQGGIAAVRHAMRATYHRNAQSIASWMIAGAWSEQKMRGVIIWELGNFEVTARSMAQSKEPFVRLLWPLTMFCNNLSDRDAELNVRFCNSLYRATNNMNDLRLLLQSCLNTVYTLRRNFVSTDSLEYRQDVARLWQMNAVVEIEQGELDEAERSLEKAKEVAVSPECTTMIELDRHERARIALKRGNLVRSEQMLREAIDKSKSEFFLCKHRLALGRVLILRGRHTEARDWLNETLGRLCRSTNTLIAAKVDTLHLLSICDSIDGRSKDAVQNAEEVLLFHENHDNSMYEGLAQLSTSCILAETGSEHLLDAEKHLKRAIERFDTSRTLTKPTVLARAYDCYGILTSKQMASHSSIYPQNLLDREQLICDEIKKLENSSTCVSALFNRGVSLLEMIQHKSALENSTEVASESGSERITMEEASNAARKAFEAIAFADSVDAQLTQYPLEMSREGKEKTRLAARRALAHCYAHGIGGEVDKRRAAELVLTSNVDSQLASGSMDKPSNAPDATANGSEGRYPGVEAFNDENLFLV